MGNKYVSENKILLLEMIKVYSPCEIDWMCYQITKNNILTLHHIEKICEGGLTLIENGALLTKRAHRILNIIEHSDYALYIDWNDLFYLINESKIPPCEDYIKEMRLLKKYTQSIVY